MTPTYRVLQSEPLTLTPLLPTWFSLLPAFPQQPPNGFYRGTPDQSVLQTTARGKRCQSDHVPPLLEAPQWLPAAPVEADPLPGCQVLCIWHSATSLSFLLAAKQPFWLLWCPLNTSFCYQLKSVTPVCPALRIPLLQLSSCSYLISITSSGAFQMSLFSVRSPWDIIFKIEIHLHGRLRLSLLYTLLYCLPCSCLL